MNDGPAPRLDNLPEISVSEVSAKVRQTVESAFQRVRVRGEISRVTTARSGHIYLTLKDDKAVLDGVCWRGTAQRLTIRPEDGMDVICTGKITTYPGHSKYQLIIDRMELAGEGALLKLLEERRRKLSAEGLFDGTHKQAIPFLPEVIGIVTSDTGAVIRDILHRVEDRFPTRLLVWPTLVQGKGAAGQIVAAIDGFNALPPGGPVPRPDLIIVARGGGSLEDMQAFNEEAVVRAAHASKIPLISAIGHETDSTLIDLAADLRAPTPTAAAEHAVPVRAELMTRVLENQSRLMRAANRRISEMRTRLDGLGRGLGDPGGVIEARAQTIDYLDQRLSGAIAARFDRWRLRVAESGNRLTTPQTRLASQSGTLALVGTRLAAAYRRRDERARARLEGAAGRVRLEPIIRACERGAAELSRLGPRLDRSTAHRLTLAGNALAAFGRVLEAGSFQRILERGFVLVRNDAGEPIVKAAALRPGEAVTLQFQDRAAAAVISSSASPAPASSAPPAPASSAPSAPASASSSPSTSASASGKLGSAGGRQTASEQEKLF